VSTVDPLQAALGGEEPEPSGAGDTGNPDGAGIDHPMLTKFGGDINKALDAYQSLESTFGQEGHRLGQTVAEQQAELAAVQEQLAALQSQQDPGMYGEVPQTANMSLEQLRQWFDESPADAAAYLISEGQAMTMAQMKAEIDERLKPLEVNVGRTTASSLVDGLKSMLGDDVVARNVDTLVQLQKTDPTFFQADPQLVLQRMKTAVLAADSEKGNQRGASNGAATQDVAVMGGSQGRNPQANDADSQPVV
jgi:hypothetical protein